MVEKALLELMAASEKWLSFAHKQGTEVMQCGYGYKIQPAKD